MMARPHNPHRKYKNLVDRILSNSIKIGECWVFDGPISTKGYGQVSVRVSGRKNPVAVLVHRYMWEQATGQKIPPGMTLDHLDSVCRHKTCWRRDHLELVTRSENTSRMRRRHTKKTTTVTFVSGLLAGTPRVST